MKCTGANGFTTCGLCSIGHSPVLTSCIYCALEQYKFSVHTFYFLINTISLSISNTFSNGFLGLLLFIFLYHLVLHFLKSVSLCQALSQFLFILTQLVPGEGKASLKAMFRSLRTWGVLWAKS